MDDFLAEMARRSTARCAEARRAKSESALQREAIGSRRPPPLRLHPAGFDVIAEVKRRAPSAGPLHPSTADDHGFAATQAESYVRGGASAVSVLTEPSAFRGKLTDLRAAADAVPVPVMRKDFLVDPYQVLEARAQGAAGVLIIARLVPAAACRALLEAAASLGLFVLFELFGEDDLSSAHAAAAAADASGLTLLIGVNSRDLRTLDVDPDRLERLAPELPPTLPWVAESGIEDPDDVRRAVSLGYAVALVGSALMRAKDPATSTAELIAAGRTEALRSCG